MVAEHGCDMPWRAPQEQVSWKICEQIVDVQVPQDVEQAIAVLKISSSDRNLLGTVERILDVLAPEMIDQLVELLKTVSKNRIRERTVEQIVVDIPVLQVAEELVGVSKVFPKDRIQQRFVEQTNETPDVSLAEKVVERPVTQTQQVVNTHVQHVVNAVEVEKSEIIEETRQEPIIQERINQVTKHVEIPLLQFMNKVVDIPVVAPRQISMVIGVHVVLVVHAPLVQIMAKTVQIPQLPYIEKIAVIPEIRTVPGPQTSESLSVDSRRLNHQDCEVLFHVNKQSPDIAGGVHVDRDVLHAGNGARTAAAAQHRSTQQQHNHHRKQQQQQAEQTEEEKKEEGKRKKGERGKEEERDAEEQECKQVKKDETGWTVVTRNKRQRKMVQVFVKVDGGKTSTMEVKMSDRVDDIVKRTPISDQDVYVTSGGRTLRRSDKLESCEVRDGSTVEITSRMRGGGRHKDKKSKVEKKQGMKQEPLKNEGPAILESEKEAVIRMLEETEEYRKIVDDVSGGSDVDMEWKMRYWASKLRERPGADILECGLRWAVEARRKGRDKQEEQRRQAKQGKRQNRNRASKASKCVSAKNNSWGRRERKTQANQR